MKQILIDYLPLEIKKDLAYKAASSKIKQIYSLQPIDSNDFITSVSQLNSDNEPLLITILSHGHSRGITFGTYTSLVTWSELCEIINATRTIFPVFLNLIAICNSNLIESYKETYGYKIDEIWVSTNTVISINKSLLASNNSSFESFVSFLDDSEKSLYKSIGKP